MSITLTPTDQLAITTGDSNYINNKGADLYSTGNYAAAVEYYRLAAAMGNVDAVSNLGYCYLYGRDIEPNTSLSIGYFKTAADRGSVDAAYKLGDVYGTAKWGVEDKELSIYYYRLAATYLIGGPWENPAVILNCCKLCRYPSLCYALGREMMPGGGVATDLEVAYQFLLQAKAGYEIALADGDSFYEKSLAGVNQLLADPVFVPILSDYEEYENYADE